MHGVIRNGNLREGATSNRGFTKSLAITLSEPKEKKKKRDSWGLGNHGSATFLHGRIPSVPLQSFYQLQNNIGATLKDRLEVRVSSCSLFSFS